MEKFKSGTVRAATPKKSTYVTPQKSKNNLAKFQAVNPLPMQYLGSKSRISRWIVNNISQKLPHATTFFDLFSGTGAVALEAASHGYEIVTNDLQPYSYAILKSTFKTRKTGISALLPKVSALKETAILLKGKRNKLRKHLLQEDEFFASWESNKFDWKKYKKFCETTPRLEDNAELKDKRNADGWHLFSWYYPNSYFGVRQCLEIDALREFADSLKADEKAHVLAAVISVMTFTVSSTTHLAQYIKPNNAKQAEFILKKRLKSIIDPVLDRLKNLKNAAHLEAQEVFNCDYLVALNKMKTDRSVVVYADPPYFKEHYSRYYHVLDTFYLYDYPQVTINPQTDKLTEGKYRKDRNVSEFGLRSKVSMAFEKMLTTCSTKKFSVAISYANTSLIDAAEMRRIIKKCGYKVVSSLEKDLMHSAQGQPSNKIAQEFLYLLEPKDEKAS